MVEELGNLFLAFIIVVPVGLAVIFCCMAIYGY